jgi:CheY-like chemotaxis protein
MDMRQYKLLLADDDVDDRILFKQALEDLDLSSNLITVNNGVELMELLTDDTGNLPDILFLDLNMPRKTGNECLAEIKGNKELMHLPVVVFSTSFDHRVVNRLYETGAHYYMRKPNEFSKLKQVIYNALSLVSTTYKDQPPKENFVLNM